uniref:Glycophorin-A n=1 Tax=Bos indicus x Bos taurus TaxID=30522 RepID=A0A4W2HFQ1_BOBOX
MDRKMIFVLLLSGYIFTKPVATQAPGASNTTRLPGQMIVVQPDSTQPEMVIAILALIAGIIGIIIGSVSLFFILQLRNGVLKHVSETSKQMEKTQPSNE